MHFGTKSYLKSTRNYTVKHALHYLLVPILLMGCIIYNNLRYYKQKKHKDKFNIKLFLFFIASD